MLAHRHVGLIAVFEISVASLNFVLSIRVAKKYRFRFGLALRWKDDHVCFSVANYKMSRLFLVFSIVNY